MKKHNFNAGPAILPQSAIDATAKALIDFDGTGLSVMCISHRSKEFEAVINEAIASVKEILQVPAGYSVLFLQGGASLQFCMVPFNLLVKKAAYVNSGVWASKALKEAKMFGEVVEASSSVDKNHSYLPKNLNVPADVDYLHITTNNTIYGTQWKADPKVSVPMAADMSSDFMSRPVDVSKYNVIYAGAQKNIGPAGVAVVIVKDAALGKVERKIPTMLDYKVHIENGSMFNTPPTVSVYTCLQTMKWLKQIGGVEAIAKKNEAKAKILYDEIDRNKMFKCPVTVAEDRSLMNICFVMSDEYKSLEDEFLNFAKAQGMYGIKGHRSVGGFRASTYNALPEESVKALVSCMQEFEKKA